MIAASLLAVLLIPAFFVITQSVREWMHGGDRDKLAAESEPAGD
jgi:predicted outer membrane lipoprotein